MPEHVRVIPDYVRVIPEHVMMKFIRTVQIKMQSLKIVTLRCKHQGAYIE